jgi:hypothetical protein
MLNLCCPILCRIVKFANLTRKTLIVGGGLEAEFSSNNVQRKNEQRYLWLE